MIKYISLTYKLVEITKTYNQFNAITKNDFSEWLRIKHENGHDYLFIKDSLKRKNKSFSRIIDTEHPWVFGLSLPYKDQERICVMSHSHNHIEMKISTADRPETQEEAHEILEFLIKLFYD